MDLRLVNLPQLAAVSLIRFYQIAVSPIKGNTCRFFPSCSEYAREAVIKFGVLKGLWLAFKRLLRCHPFHPGGYDPLP